MDNRQNWKSPDRGATLVELALVFPFFCFLIFAVVDLSRLSLGYSSLRSASTLAIRRAAGVERNAWPSIEAIFGSAQSQALTKLKSSPLFQTPSGDPKFYTAGARNAQVNGSILKVEARAMAYAYELLKKDTGALSYPCSNEGNCSWCFPLRGEENLLNSISTPPGSNAARVPLLGMECHYSVSMITSGFTFGLVPRVLEMTTRSYFPLDGYHSNETGI